MKRLIFGLLVGLMLPCGARAQVADMLLVNGKVLTVDRAFSTAEAVAVRDGRIVAVGTSADVRKLAGAGARVVDLAGRTVIPGLIDSHIHAIDPGTTFGLEVSWAGVPSLERGLQLIAEAARKTAPGTWITVIGGWDEFQFAEKRRPTPAELQAAAPDRPVYVEHLFDWAALTPPAMEGLGLKPGTPLPANGAVEVDAAGKPTGIVTGNTGTFLTLMSKLPKPSFAQEVDGLRQYLQALTRVGLTGIIDADGRSPVAPHFEPILKLWQDHALPLRVAFYVQAEHRGKELADYQDYTRLLATGFGDEMLRFNGIGEVVIWGMHDGGCCGQVFDADEPSRESLYQVARWAAGRGVSLQIHATTDHSAERILDIFERVNAEAPIGNLRWMIAHLEDASVRTLQRMKAMGMAWTVQDRLYFKGDEYLKKSEAAARRAPPIKTGLAMGLVVAGGSDAPRVAPYNPFVSLRWLVDGKSVVGTAISAADESPSREEALRMYTLNGAWIAHDEADLGSLEVGKRADLVVLDRDYLTVPVEEISAIRPLLTMVGGRAVHAEGPFAALQAGAR